MIKILNTEKDVTLIIGETTEIKALYKSFYRQIKKDSVLFEQDLSGSYQFDHRIYTYAIILVNSGYGYHLDVMRGDYVLGYLLSIGYLNKA